MKKTGIIPELWIVFLIMYCLDCEICFQYLSW